MGTIWAMMLPVTVVGLLLLPAMVLVRRHSRRDLFRQQAPQDPQPSPHSDSPQALPPVMTRVR